METMFTGKVRGKIKKLLALVIVATMMAGALPATELVVHAENAGEIETLVDETEPAGGEITEDADGIAETSAEEDIPASLAASIATIAEWKYTAKPSEWPATATGGVSTGATLGIVGATSTGAYSSSSITSTAWNVEEAYWLLGNVSTVGYEDLAFSASMRSSSTGPKDFQMEYQIQGAEGDGAWVKVEDSNMQVTSTVLANNGYNSLSLPIELEDCEAVNLRIIKTSNDVSSSTTESQIVVGGTSNINNIVISGTAIDGEENPDDPGDPDDPDDPEVPGREYEGPDPISDEHIASISGAISIAKAIEQVNAGESGIKTVVGQVVYRYSDYGGTGNRTVIIEDIIDKKIVALQVYGSNDLYTTAVGSIVAVTGTIADRNGAVQASNVTDIQTIESTDPIEPWEATIQELIDEGAVAISRYVVIKNVTLGAYSSTASTSVSDSTATISIYRAATYPSGIGAGDNINLYAAFSTNFETRQLRNGSPEDYQKIGSSSYEEDITVPVAKWSGGGDYTGINIVYGDLYAANDQLDENANITLFKAGVTAPLYSGSISYMGGVGLGTTANDYYQLEVSTKKVGNLSLSFQMRSTASAPKSFTVSYSGDGETFTEAGSISITTAGNLESFELKLPEGVNNLEKLHIRLLASTEAVNGSTSTSSGTNRFLDVNITGNPIISDDVCKVVKADPISGEIQSGQEITLTCGTDDATIYYNINGAADVAYNSESKPVLSDADFPVTLTTYAVKNGISDSLELTYNYTQVQVLPVSASPNGGAVAEGSKITLTCKTDGAVIQYSLNNGTTWLTYDSAEKITLSDLSVETATIILVRAVKTGYKNSAETALSFTSRQNDKYGLYFGQLHSHTEYSDGSGTAEDAYTYASSTDRKNIDFLALTDHSNSFDGNAPASISDTPASTEWAEGHTLAERFTSETFVGLFGYEMTWSNGLGHINTYNTEGFQSRTQSAYTTYSTALQNYYAALKTDTASISQFNHPGTTFGDFSDFAHYDEGIDDLITIIEVGNGEGAIGSSGYFPSYEYYTRALDKGWHVAPTNNQDNHKGRWGDANTGRTVVLADTLTEENVYDAIRNMRVYATEDDDLEIYYTLDGYEMGSRLDESIVGDTVDLKVELNDDTDKSIGKVQVIANGGLVLGEKTVSSAADTVEFELPSSYSYYYIKVVQTDGNIAVTAPVWVGEVEAVGITSLTTDTVLPVTGEALDVTLEMYNNEKSDLVIESVSFSVDEEEIHSITDLAANNFSTVASMGTNSYTFPYENSNPGAVSIEASITATLDGVAKLYKGVLKLSYVTPDMVTKIVVDGTHYNDYVKGYYGGNMGNFATIAAERYAEVHIETEAITDALLADCDLLIVSAPAKKSGTANAGDYVASTFEESFLEVVKNYTDAGGTIIVCGLADYQDTAVYQTATETNKLLDAIGATIKMNNDEAYDTENNGGQAYRLYYTNFNMESQYLANVVEATDDVEGQTFSAYSGCTVDITGAATDSDTAKAAEALVSGHSTTYSIDSRAADGTAPSAALAPIVVAAGEVVALATQELTGGGRVFVAGSVFMSDFEVKAELDNIWDLPYANRTIIENIVDDVADEMTITTIAEARKGTLKDIFRVQGTVTAGTAIEANTFFDAIYIQDATGGMTIFPYATQGLKVGATVDIIGYLDEYQGDIEIQVMKSTILDNENLNPIAPASLSTKEAMDYSTNGGKLIKVEGKVTEVDKDGDKVNQIKVQDENGDTATVFIDGYIYSATTGTNTLGTFVKVGNTISAVGLLYKHPEGDSDVSVSCLRVRNCDEIVLVSAGIVQQDQTITVNPASYTKTYGDAAFNISASTDGGGALTFASLNAKVCTVDSSTGRVTITGAGTATINITAAATTNYKTATRAVTVTVNPKATTLTVNPASYTKTFGDKAFNLSVKNDGDGALSYTTSNAKVCTVNSSTGLVTIKGVGKATITVTAAATTNCKAATSTIAITVNKANATITAKTSYTKTLGNKAFSLSAKTNGKGKLTYSTSSSKIAKVSSAGKVTIKGTGKATITITAAATTNYKKATKKVAITVKPKKVSISKVTSTKAKTLKATWKKASDVTGYEILIASNKGFTKNKSTVTIKKAGTTNRDIPKLKSGTTYRVKIRAYKGSGKNRVYGAYSNVRTVKVK